MAKVAVETEGAITIVSIDRFAEARNAVDPETAACCAMPSSPSTATTPSRSQS